MAGIVLSWPDLGVFDPAPRILRDGRGFERWPRCPVCRRDMRHPQVRRSSWRNAPKFDGDLATWRLTSWCHCNRCKVRWQEVKGTYPSATYWCSQGPETFWVWLLRTGSWSLQDHYMAWREQTYGEAV